MTDRDVESRTDWLITVFWLTFLAATVPNTIEAFADIEEPWWTSFRIVLSAVFTCVVLALALDRLGRRTRRPENRSAEGK